MRTLKTYKAKSKQQKSIFNLGKIKAVALLFVVLVAILIFSACAEQKTGEAILKIVSPEVIPSATYNLNEEADEITVTFTAQWANENSKNDNKVYVNLVDVTGDTASGGVIIQNEYEVLSEKVGNRFVATEQEFTFKVPTNRVGKRNYFVNVEHTHTEADGDTKKTLVSSGLFTITVVDPNSSGDDDNSNSDSNNTQEDDTFELGITRQPRGGNFKIGDNINLSLETNAPQDMQISYQWYSRTSGNGDFSPITGATSSSYSPPSNYEYSGHAYRCVVTQVGTGDSLTSGIVNVSVAEPFVYTFEITSHPTGGSYTASGSVPLVVSASTNSGNPLRYQWYTNLTNSVEGAVAIQGANSNVFYVNTTHNSNQFYFCYVTDSYKNTPRTIASNIANVVVTGANPTPTPTPTPATHDVWVKGVQITAANAADVFASDPTFSGKVSYNFATKTLTLNNARLDYTSLSLSADAYKNAVIGSNTDLIVELVGTNIINMASGGGGTQTSAISTNGSLTFTGGGKLTATAPWLSHGFVVGGNLIVGATEVSVTGASGDMGIGGNGYNGASVSGTLTVGGSSWFTATGGMGSMGASGVAGVNGGAGGMGGTGGNGVAAAAITVSTGGTLQTTGGQGGQGGNGVGTATGKGSGGMGGTGGDGYILPAGVTYTGTITTTGGSGGIGGNSGDSVPGKSGQSAVAGTNTGVAGGAGGLNP